MKSRHLRFLEHQMKAAVRNEPFSSASEKPVVPPAQPNRKTRREQQARARALANRLRKDPKVASVEVQPDGGLKVNVRTPTPEPVCTCTYAAALTAANPGMLVSACPVHVLGAS